MAVKEIRKNLSFDKGMEQSVDSSLLGDGYSPMLKQVDIEDGILKGVNLPELNQRLDGYIVNRIVRYHAGLEEYLFGLVYDTKNSEFIFAEIKDNKVRNIEPLPSSSFDYINYKLGQDDVIIYCCDGQNTKVYDIKTNTLRDLKRLGASSEASFTNNAPWGSNIELHKERVFLSGNWGAPNRVYFSKDFDPDDWTTPSDEINANNHGGFIDIMTFDSSRITAIKSMFDRVVIFKKQSVFAIYGDNPSNYGVTQLFVNTSGEINDKTIQTIGNFAYFVSTDGIYRLEGYGYSIKNLTPRVKKFFDSIDKEDIKKATAAIHKNKYYVSFRDNLLVYDTDNDTFVIRKGTDEPNRYIQSIGIFKDELYSAQTNMLLKFNDVLTPKTHELLSCEAISRYDNNSSTGVVKKSKQIDFIGTGTAELRITVMSDKGSKSKIVKLLGPEKRYRVKLKRKGFIHGVKIESLNSNDFEIRDMQILFETYS